MLCSPMFFLLVALLPFDPVSSVSDEELDPMLAGCGPNLHLTDSYHYGRLNQEMHHGMAINFTGNAEYDFLAGMIPHHYGAGEMCKVYLNSTQSGGGNPGIESLCYNITYGPVKWGEYQFDFSQLGEIEQMKDALDLLHMLQHYEQGCEGLTELSMCELAEQSGHGMYMGCGQIDLEMTRDYIKVNMEMHTLMALNWTGNADIDFLLGMIPHHEAALKMCDIYYKYWTCAPERSVCVDPLPADEIQPMLSNGQPVDILNQMHHMCTEHIAVSQPPEIEWMKKELGRISPAALEDYETRGAGYPCGLHAHGGMHSGHSTHSGHSMHSSTDPCAHLMSDLHDNMSDSHEHEHMNRSHDESHGDHEESHGDHEDGMSHSNGGAHNGSHSDASGSHKSGGSGYGSHSDSSGAQVDGEYHGTGGGPASEGHTETHSAGSEGHTETHSAGSTSHSGGSGSNSDDNIPASGVSRTNQRAIFCTIVYLVAPRLLE